MRLSDEFKTAGQSSRLNQIEKAIGQLSADDLKDFITALHDVSVPASAIERVLLKRGIHIDARRIREYRNNGGRVRYGLDGQRVAR